METSLVQLNHTSDNHDMLQNCVNYSHRKLFIECAKYKSFKRHKSCTDIVCFKIDREESAMGTRVSRSNSADNVSKPTSSFVYEHLSRVNLVNNNCQAEIDGDENEEYQLLDSSDEDNDFQNCLQLNPDSNNECCDGQRFHNSAKSCENITEKTVNEHISQLNGSVNCSVIGKFSTLPRAKSRKKVARKFSEARNSCEISVDCANFSKENEKSVENFELNDNLKIQKSDKIDKSGLFPSTTLPKARSRRCIEDDNMDYTTSTKSMPRTIGDY
jgi:hypothetical protein